MQYLIIGRDGTDEKALERRLAAREAHLALGDRMREQGTAIFGVAILDEAEKMVGSVYICNFDARAELDQWLKEEPYVTGNVWQDIEITKCRVGPSFVKV